MRPFQYLSPRTIEEAVRILAEHGAGARPLAGGTDIVVQMKEGATRFPHPQYVIGLERIGELQGIDFAPSDGLRIGAATKMADIAAHPVVRERYSALGEGAGVIGSRQTLNMATIGGNLCNAAPSADTAPALLAYEAAAVIVGPAGRRSIPLSDLFAGPGLTTLAPGEILAELRLRAPVPATGGAYRRHTPRKQMDIAVVGVAAVVSVDGSNRIGEARIALGAVAPTPIRATQAEGLLASRAVSDDAFARAAEAAAGECSPITDLRGSADFRRHLVRVMTERMLREAVARAKAPR